MAANYWVSTQRLHWQFTREKLAEIRQKLEDEDKQFIQQFPLPERRLLSMYFNKGPPAFIIFEFFTNM